MLTKTMLKKQFTLECDQCGAVSVCSINDLTCKNPKCGYHLRPPDDLLVNLFGKAMQVVGRSFSVSVQSVGVLPVDQMAATIIDESKWNWRYDSVNGIWIPPDYAKWQTTDGIHIIKKASQGLWDDPTWEAGKGLILSRGIGLGAYHYADVYFDAVASADKFAQQALAMPGEFIWGTTDYPQFWLDCESNRGSGSVNYSPAQMEQYLKAFTDRFMLVCGYPIGIYTRSIWWDDHVSRNTWAHHLALWVARYNNQIIEPGEPQDWSNYGKKPVLWQWSADGNGEGYKYGYHSNSVDKNRSPLLTTPEVQQIVYGETSPPPSGLPAELLIQDPSTGEQQLYRQV